MYSVRECGRQRSENPAAAGVVSKIPASACVGGRRGRACQRRWSVPIPRIHPRCQSSLEKVCFFFHLSENKENGVLYCHNLCRCFPVLKNSVPFLVGAI